MVGIDRLISFSLSDKMKKRMGIDNLKKVERELFLEHGMSIKLSIEHFDKFRKVFKKNSDLDINEFEKKCIDEIIKVQKIKEKYFVTIVDNHLSNLILEAFGDLETRKIILALLENEYTIPQILKESKIPKTSGYRKIENLLINGLLIETGKVLSESKKISKIQFIFQKFTMDIHHDSVKIDGVISKKMFEKSTSMKLILESFE